MTEWLRPSHLRGTGRGVADGGWGVLTPALLKTGSVDPQIREWSGQNPEFFRFLWCFGVGWPVATLSAIWPRTQKSVATPLGTGTLRRRSGNSLGGWSVIWRVEGLFGGGRVILWGGGGRMTLRRRPSDSLGGWSVIGRYEEAFRRLRGALMYWRVLLTFALLWGVWTPPCGFSRIARKRRFSVFTYLIPMF